MAAWMRRMDAAPTATLLDPKGAAGSEPFFGYRSAPKTLRMMSLPAFTGSLRIFLSSSPTM